MSAEVCARFEVEERVLVAAKRPREMVECMVRERLVRLAGEPPPPPLGKRLVIQWDARRGATLGMLDVWGRWYLQDEPSRTPPLVSPQVEAGVIVGEWLGASYAATSGLVDAIAVALEQRARGGWPLTERYGSPESVVRYLASALQVPASVPKDEGNVMIALGRVLTKAGEVIAQARALQASLVSGVEVEP
jgi:hypothetical protein